MNILHMKYAVEVARIGSINKAAEELFIAQPNLSRYIKELESKLGITIFRRSSRGMELTPEGSDFIRYAERALSQIDEIEKMFTEKDKPEQKQKFSISVPRASYITEAFTHFTKQLGPQEAEIFYMETNAERAINNILTSEYKLGVVRYDIAYDKYYKEMLESKGLGYEMISEFSFVIVLSAENPLSEKEVLEHEDLSHLVEIIHGDAAVPFMALSTARKQLPKEDTNRTIILFERGSQFELLSENPETFMWVSPLPQKLLDRYGLVTKHCNGDLKRYKDVLIFPKGYRFSDLDNRFITELTKAKREVMKK